MVRQNDQVFQLSLTEIAFTIAFLLLLLLGYLVYEAQSDRQAAEAELAKVRTTERATDALTAVKSELLTMLQGAGIANPDEVVSKLSDVEQARSERNQLRQRVDDLEAQLTALIELKKQLEQAAAASRPDVTLDAVLSALVLREEVRAAVEQSEQGAYETAMRDKQMMETVRQALSTTTELRRQLKEMLGRDLQPGQEGQAIQEVVAAAKSFGELAKGGQSSEMIKKENTDLRGQVAFLKNRLDADGGRDYPPCWADESGKVEFLFSVEVRPDSVVITPAWTARREAAAKALPGIEEVLAGPHSHQAFVSKIQGIFNWSRAQDPECRYYVRLRSSILDAVKSDRARLMVENYFYKVEVRR